MTPLSIIGLFCEDIRFEKGDVTTLVGLLSDNINTSTAEDSSEKEGGKGIEQNKFLTKLCIFARANFEINDPIEEFQLRLVLPNEDVISIGGATPQMIEDAKRQATEKGNLLAGIVMRTVMHPFPLPKFGILRLEAVIGSETRLVGHLNVRGQVEVKAPSAS